MCTYIYIYTYICIYTIVRGGSEVSLVAARSQRFTMINNNNNNSLL